MAIALPGKELAEALEAESRTRTLRTPMEGVVEAAAAQASPVTSISGWSASCGP